MPSLLYLVRPRGGEMTKLRELAGRFDRWTLDVFNPEYPLPTRRR